MNKKITGFIAVSIIILVLNKALETGLNTYFSNVDWVTWLIIGLLGAYWIINSKKINTNVG